MWDLEFLDTEHNNDAASAKPCPQAQPPPPMTLAATEHNNEEASATPCPPARPPPAQRLPPSINRINWHEILGDDRTFRTQHQRAEAPTALDSLVGLYLGPEERADSIQVIATPHTSIDAATHSRQLLQSTALATQHVVPILMTEADIPNHRATAKGILHDFARALLNDLALERVAADNDVVDVEPLWNTWREYIATHSQAKTLIGPGISSVTAHRIPGTRDPNRGGVRRVDFVIERVDGSAYRIHPGTTRKSDSKPVYVSAANILQGAATEYSDMQALRNVPQVDTWGVKHTFDTLSQLEIPRGGCDLTDGTIFPWHLFLANLARRGQRLAVQDDVQRVQLMRVDEHLVCFKLTSSTDSEKMIHIGREWKVGPRGAGFKYHTYVSKLN